MQQESVQATKKKSLPFNTTFFYGWIIVVASGLTLFFSGPGQTYSVSIFIDSYIKEFGWSRSLVSSMYSTGTLCAGLIMWKVGGFFDKNGHRLMTTIIAVLFGFACLWLSFVNSLFMLFIGFFLVRLLGQGSMSLSSTTLVPQWFVRKRGFALSLVSLAGACSAALLPPFNTWLIKTYGWQLGWRFWAIILWIIMAPLAYLLMRDRPEQVGLWPDGDQESAELKESVSQEKVGSEEDWTLAEAMKTRSFWILLFCASIPSAVGTGLTFHQVSIMGEVGLSIEVAALVLSVMALIRLPVIFAAGQAADRVEVRYMLSASLAGLGLSLVILLLTTSKVLAFTYGIVRGVTMGMQAIINGVIWPNYFGRRHLGSIRGVSMVAMVIGSAFGPLPFGFAYDLFGGYTQIIIGSMIFTALGTVGALMATKPDKSVVLGN